MKFKELFARNPNTVFYVSGISTTLHQSYKLRYDNGYITDLQCPHSVSPDVLKAVFNDFLEMDVYLSSNFLKREFKPSLEVVVW